jgi:hypothetical protein
MTDDCIEVVLVNSKASVSLTEPATVVVCRAAEDLGHQQSLVALESRHVDPIEVGRKLGVAENPLVKVIYDSTDGRPAANCLVVAHGPANRLISHGMLVLPAKANSSKLLTMHTAPRESLNVL